MIEDMATKQQWKDARDGQIYKPGIMDMRFWWPWGSKESESERVFKLSEVKELIEDIKEFNAGCIDEYLSEHVDRVFKNWLDK